MVRVMPVFMGVGFVFFFKYAEHPPAWLYYTGMTILFATMSTFFTVSRSMYTKVIERTRHVNLLLGVSFALSGAATFVGSSLGGVLLNVEVGSNATLCSVNYQTGSFQASGCSLSGIDVCMYFAACGGGVCSQVVCQ
jgi:hypothetical protein